MQDKNEKSEAKGLVIRGANGDIYFLREEILEAAKVTEPEMKKFIESVANEHYKKEPKRFSVNLGSIEKAVPVSGIIDRSKIDMRAMSTIMCPGVMHDNDFVVLPEIEKNF